jgi:PPM family protein phosphatase
LTVISDEIIALVMPEVQTETPALRIAACIGQHQGDRREQQDRVALLTSLRDPRCALAVLADGVGGVSGGALAAENAIAVSRRRFAEFDPRSGSPETFFRALVAEIHTVLRIDGLATGLRPHTTFAALMLQPDRADWCHVGDSRIHHIRAGRMRHRSVDQKVQRGSGPQVETLGGTHTPRPECDSETGLRVEDCYLLCSDGLSNYLSEAELAAAATALAPREAVEALIGTARERAGGKGDNCSLALLRLGKPPARRPGRHPGAASRPTKAPGK